MDWNLFWTLGLNGLLCASAGLYGGYLIWGKVSYLP